MHAQNPTPTHPPPTPPRPAGMWEFKRQNTFGAAAFTSYGAFWMGFVLLQILAAVGTGGRLGQEHARVCARAGSGEPRHQRRMRGRSFVEPTPLLFRLACPLCVPHLADPPPPQADIFVVDHNADQMMLSLWGILTFSEPHARPHARLPGRPACRPARARRPASLPALLPSLPCSRKLCCRCITPLAVSHTGPPSLAVQSRLN